MNFMKFKLHSDFFLSSQVRSNFLSLITVIFALFYHLSFLFVFLFLRIMPLFYFNVGSVTLFFIFSILLLKKNVQLSVYILSMIEVIAHQILADYLLGGQSSFHFFILLTGLMPFLVFLEKPAFSFSMGFISSILFVFLEVNVDKFVPVYKLSSSAIMIIRCVNVSLSVIVILAVIMIFSIIVLNIEKNLTTQVEVKTNELQQKNEKLISIQNNTIISLANLVENRDVDTGEHVKRTSAYVKLLAKRASLEKEYSKILDEHFIELLGKAAPMHDIGKISVPDSVLKKPGKLTEEEFIQIQKHTTEGSRIVYEVLVGNEDSDYVNMASDIALCHHEKWNGLGYPNKLKENEIPLSARIMAIADVFDALVSPRCYKEPMPVDKAFEIIKESSGTHFDPILAKDFIEIKDQVIEAMRRY